MSAITSHELFDPIAAEAMVKGERFPYFTIIDDDYPESLRMCIRPPIVLFYQGNIDLLKEWENTVTIVGSRKASEESLNRIRLISKELADRGYNVVSGLARGTDTAALEPAVEKGRAIAVIGTGLDVFYPSENEDLQVRIGQTGLLLSEYPSGVRPAQDHFPKRNRILAALSPATILGEAHYQSGTLITSMIASEEGREVGCLPFRVEDATANNRLIKDGAALVETAQDIIDLLPPNQRKRYQKDEE